ncbi:hypothetical protein F5Y11DRAFT_344748 [Daldinia sp. FL1419]|nr:hypothetical protein F5Y11DRAFT_344748 [Daldinia sp. FL1419]
MASTELSQLIIRETPVRPPIPSNLPSNLAVNPGEFSLLASIPRDIHCHLISFLSIYDVICLRRVSRHYYHYFTRENITKHFSKNRRLDPELLSCCVECFGIFDYPLVIDEERWWSPWRSICYWCFRVKRSPAYHNTGKSTRLAFTDKQPGHVCSFCGWPVYRRRIHRGCRRTAELDFVLFSVRKPLYWISLFFFISTIRPRCVPSTFYVATAVELCLIPGQVQHLLDDILRRSVERFWHLDLIMGPILIYLWSSSIIRYFWELYMVPAEECTLDSCQFTMTYMIYRLLIHVLRTAGIVLWARGYDSRDHFLPGLSLSQRSRYMFYTWLVSWWTVKDHLMLA